MALEENMKKISVICIIYNVEKYLERCIESLVNQTYKNLEIILVDDDSPDNCPKICDEWAKKDNRIKVIHKKNGGVSDARNKGMEIATGEYIAFVDADDFLSKDMYKVLVDILEEKNADFSTCKDSRFYDGEEPIFTIEDQVYVFENSNDVLKNLLSKDNIILNNVWNKLYKKELFDGIEFPYGESAQDISTIYKVILRAQRVASTKSKLYAYLQRKESVMHSCTPKFVLNHINAIHRRYDDLKDNEELVKNLNVTMAKDLYYCFVQATMVRDENFYNSQLLLNEYKLLRKLVNFKNFKDYLAGVSNKVKVLKIILLFDRKLFWKIRTRKNNKEKI